MNNEPVAWMYERPNGSAKLTFVREPMAGTVVTETPLYTHPVKEQDALRYQWLRTEFEAGRETYLAEGMPSGESLDKYIDEQLRKAQEK
jgi:hypothetical protein